MYQFDPIQTLANVDYSRADTFGERACSLSRLMSKGYRIPYGVVISTKVFKKFLNTIPGTKRIDHLMDQINWENLDETALEIQDIILRSPVPMSMKNQIAEEIYRLLDRIESKSVVIRTSAHVEDSSRHVCFGRGVFFHLKDIREILNLMKNCWASAFTPDVLKDLIQAGLPPDNVNIAVIIEEMITARTSGILIVKKESISGEGDVQIRANWGSQVYEENNGIYCDQIIVNEKKIGEPIEIYRSYKEKISCIPEDTKRTMIIENKPEKKVALSVSEQNIGTLIQLARKIQKDFEVDYEIEFIFDHNDSLWLLDAIPKSGRRGYYHIGHSSKHPIK
ncbi:MAG: PEP/pyruvate-binding domain-containing protein [Candidatus Hodarchaeota archaeon]